MKKQNHTELMLKYLGANIGINENSTTVSASELIAKNIEIVGNLDIKELQPMSLFEAECEELSWFMVEKCLKKAQN